MNATLIYDASCPVCCAARDWVERNALPGMFDFVPCQSEARVRRFPEVGEERCMTAMHLVFADGRTFAGDAALPQICLGLRRWRWVARVLRTPPISIVSPAAYRFFAKRRHAFSALVARKPVGACPVPRR